MRYRRSSRYISTAAVSVMILASCGEEGGQAGDGNGEVDTDARLTVATSIEPPSLDSAYGTQEAITFTMVNVFETLLTRDSDLEFQPALAESWEVSEDSLIYTFHLREGVIFHNGDEMTADDIVASMDRWSRLSGPGQAYFEGATWTAEDDYTVVLELEQPSYGIELALSSDYQQIAAIMPAAIAEAAGDDPIDDAIGTGPFEFVEHQPGRHLTLDRYEDYQPFEGEPNGRAGDRTPQISGIDFEFVTDGSTRLLGLETGEYDFVAEVPYDSADEVLENDSLVTDSYPMILLNLYYNKAQGIFEDVEARRAVDTALDREGIMAGAVGGNEDFYTINHSIMLGAQSAQWDSDVGLDQFDQNDPDAAEQMLEDLGISGETVRIIATRDYEESYGSAVVLQQQLSDIGLDVELDVYDWPTFTDIREDPANYEIAIIPNTARDDPLQSSFMRDDFAGFTDSPELDELSAEISTAASLEEAQEYYDDLQEWFWDYLPVSKFGDAERIYSHPDNIDLDVEGTSVILWSATIEDD